MQPDDQGSQTTKDKSDTKVPNIPMAENLMGANYNSLDRYVSEVESDTASRTKEIEAYIKQAQILVDGAMKGVTGGPKRDHGPPYINDGPNKCDMVAMTNEHACVETCKDDSDTLRTTMGMEDGTCLSNGFYTAPTMVDGVGHLNAICMGILNISYYSQTSAPTGGSDLAVDISPADDGCGDVYHRLVADHCQTLCVEDASKIQDVVKLAGAEQGNCTAANVGYTEYLGTMEVRIVAKLIDN